MSIKNQKKQAPKEISLKEAQDTISEIKKKQLQTAQTGLEKLLKETNCQLIATLNTGLQIVNIPIKLINS